MPLKKALLYFPVLLNNNESGVSKKCLGIVDAFKQKYSVDVFSESSGLVYFNDQLIKDRSQNTNNVRLYYYNDIFFGQFHLIKNEIEQKKYDIVYIRFPGYLSFGLLHFLYRLKKSNPAIIISVEIATYPYTKEIVGWLPKMRHSLTRLLIPLFRKYVSNIVTFSTHQTIWGIPAINITNGYYNPELQIELNNCNAEFPDTTQDKIQIAMIAQFNNWHAPDILIESLHQYYKKQGGKREVILHLIGSGAGLLGCKKLVETYALDARVKFYGRRNTGDIVKIISQTDLCVGTLGYHRKHITVGSCLKNREYAFLGKPIVLKTQDFDFPESLYFVKYFPDDGSLLNIEEVISFYENIQSDHPNYKKEIMHYAKENLSWRKKMTRVFENYERRGIVSKDTSNH